MNFCRSLVWDRPNDAPCYTGKVFAIDDLGGQRRNLGWDRVTGAVRYVAGICGGRDCRLWEEPSANVVRPLGAEELGPLSDEEGRFTVAAWAVDACGNWGESFSTAFTYVGPGGAGSVCDFCCPLPSDECVGICSEGLCAKECNESASCN